MPIDLDAIAARHQHDHAEDGGVACPSCEADVSALVAEVRKLRERIRSVRDEILSEGYHRPNELILLMDDALGEDHGY